MAEEKVERQEQILNIFGRKKINRTLGWIEYMGSGWYFTFSIRLKLTLEW